MTEDFIKETTERLLVIAYKRVVVDKDHSILKSLRLKKITVGSMGIFVTDALFHKNKVISAETVVKTSDKDLSLMIDAALYNYPAQLRYVMK